MAYVLKLELIGDQWGLKKETQLLTRIFLGGIPPSAWVAEIAGKSDRYGYERQFLKCKKDYSKSNSTGTRGVYVFYILQSGHCYEVKCRISWKRGDRYFCRIEGTELIRMSKEEVDQWLKDHSE